MSGTKFFFDGVYLASVYGILLMYRISNNEHKAVTFLRELTTDQLGQKYMPNIAVSGQWEKQCTLLLPPSYSFIS